MDPATLATAVTAFLVPFLSKVGQTIADQAQQKLPDEIGRIWDLIASRFKGKPAAESSGNDLKAKANDSDNQEAFALQLKKALKDDPAFAVELEQLFQTAQTAAGIVNTGNGVVATQGGVAAGASGIAIGGNVGGSIVLGSHNTIADSVNPPPDHDSQNTGKPKP